MCKRSSDPVLYRWCAPTIHYLTCARDMEDVLKTFATSNVLGVFFPVLDPIARTVTITRVGGFRVLRTPNRVGDVLA